MSHYTKTPHVEGFVNEMGRDSTWLTPNHWFKSFLFSANLSERNPF